MSVLKHTSVHRWVVNKICFDRKRIYELSWMLWRWIFFTLLFHVSLKHSLIRVMVIFNKFSFYGHIHISNKANFSYTRCDIILFHLCFSRKVCAAEVCFFRTTLMYIKRQFSFWSVCSVVSEDSINASYEWGYKSIIRLDDCIHLIENWVCILKCLFC